eukprot:TRINITY_DN11840_c0_g2_i11.p1 TRINITY_DN11840_c0_g2~~TRINITY_DN11840_c0_g2_i11.p1  ORF type:complete len:148 (+),score=25.78 TRINITY_DN11840_c0_g2_i11:119-562(+)
MKFNIKMNFQPYLMGNVTGKMRTLRMALIILCVGHGTFIILFVFSGYNAIYRCMHEFLCALMLIMAICSIPYCFLAIYVIFVGINVIMTFARVGISIQHDELYNWEKYDFIINTMAFIFYVFCLHIALSAYKAVSYTHLTLPTICSV